MQRVTTSTACTLMEEHLQTYCTNIASIRLHPEVKSQLNPATTSLTGFTGEKIWPMGNYDYRLWLAIRSYLHNSLDEFYGNQNNRHTNGIIGRPGSIEIRAVRQLNRGASSESAKAILEEVHKLVEAGLVDQRVRGPSGPQLEGLVDDLVIKEAHTTLLASSRVLKKQKAVISNSPFTALDERSPVVKWEVSRFEQVPIQVSRQVTPLVQNTQEVYEEGRLPLDYRSRRSFHTAQVAYRSTSHANRTPTRGGVDNIFIHDAWGN
ncbi:hypothetical protein Tco_0490264 [Tanacetum coccineum]